MQLVTLTHVQYYIQYVTIYKPKCPTAFFIEVLPDCEEAVGWGGWKLPEKIPALTGQVTVVGKRE